MRHILSESILHAKQTVNFLLRPLSANAKVLILTSVLLCTSLANADSIRPASLRGIPYADSLLPEARRPNGTAINGIALSEGEVKWAAGKGVIIGEQGATTTSPGGAHHSINAVAGTIRLQADVNPQGSGFTGLALGRGDLSGNFWENLSLLFFVSSGSYNVVVGSENLIAEADKKLLHADSANQVELSVDTISRTVTARLNGTLVLDAISLPATARLADITAAGFRFNEPVTAGAPSVSNYRAEVVSKASAGLELIDLGMCFVAPNKKALCLHFAMLTRAIAHPWHKKGKVFSENRRA